MKHLIFTLSLVISIGLTQDNSSFMDSPHNLSGDTTSTYLAICRTCHISGGQGYQNANDINQTCIHCHDGSVTHSFQSSGELHNISSISSFYHSFKLDSKHTTDLPVDDDQIHCATCHDPHDNTHGNFLRKPVNKLCSSCHASKDLDASLHGHSISILKNVKGKIECSTCHDIHRISSNRPLLIADENTLCISCHDGIQNNENELPTLNDIRVPLNKLYIHLGMEELHKMDTAISCSDCHNPHTIQENEVGLISGVLFGVDGINTFGKPVSNVTYEYEICYKCHSTSTQTPFSINIAEKFSTTNKSYHPVEGLSSNPNASMSLKLSNETIGLITCSDCHGNDNAFGVQGIHGSNHEGLLVKNYSKSPFTQESTLQDNELCFSCHDYDYIVGSGGFRWHKLHIETGQYNCIGCHDSHGSPLFESLIDLNKPYIQPTHTGDIDYTSNGDGSGSCSLTCHGHVHLNQVY